MTKSQRFVRYVLPLLVLLSIIFYLSGDVGSSEHSRVLVRSILRTFFPSLAAQLSNDWVLRIDFDIRKTGHISEYALLAILAYRALAQNNNKFRSRYAAFALFLAIGYAASDEWHQSFIPSRWGVAADLLYDSFGATIGTILCLWRHHLRRNRQN
jgi:VanZ family protein